MGAKFRVLAIDRRSTGLESEFTFLVGLLFRQHLHSSRIPSARCLISESLHVSSRSVRHTPDRIT